MNVYVCIDRYTYTLYRLGGGACAVCGGRWISPISDKEVQHRLRGAWRWPVYRQWEKRIWVSHQNGYVCMYVCYVCMYHTVYMTVLHNQIIVYCIRETVSLSKLLCSISLVYVYKDIYYKVFQYCLRKVFDDSSHRRDLHHRHCGPHASGILRYCT